MGRKQGNKKKPVEGAEVEVRSMNEASASLMDKFAVHDKDGKDLIIGH
jgi:SulP family sulfate permease